MTDQVTCKDCVHSIRGLTLNERIGSWFFDPPGKFLKCRRTIEETVERDYVTGRNAVEQKISYCSTERKFVYESNGECGPQGIHWVPKHKKDLFKLMTRIGNETD